MEINGVHMDKIEEKLDNIDRRIDNIDKHLAVYNTQLKFHIKRTDMLEEEIKPLKAGVIKAQGAMMFVGVLATVISIGVALWGVVGG